MPYRLLGHLRQTIQSLTGHKHKYDELLDQMEQKEQQRAQARRRLETVKREERVRRQDELKTLESQLYEKIRELATVKDRCLQLRLAPPTPLLVTGQNRRP
jgi:hypothetical protein